MPRPLPTLLEAIDALRALVEAYDNTTHDDAHEHPAYTWAREVLRRYDAARPAPRPNEEPRA